jgi:hypothetical protein
MRQTGAHSCLNCFAYFVLFFCHYFRPLAILQFELNPPSNEQLTRTIPTLWRCCAAWALQSERFGQLPSHALLQLQHH